MSPNSTTAPEITGIKEPKSKDSSWWKRIRGKSSGYKRLETPGQPTDGDRHQQKPEAPSGKIANGQGQDGAGSSQQQRVVVRQRRAPAVESRHPTYTHMREMQSNFLGGR